MADDLGAVRRTPRPTPHLRSTGDRQTPETAAQPGAGTTNEASPVSGDRQAVSSRVSSQGDGAPRRWVHGSETNPPRISPREAHDTGVGLRNDNGKTWHWLDGGWQLDRKRPADQGRDTKWAFWALVEHCGPVTEVPAEQEAQDPAGLAELRAKLAETFEGVPGSVVFGHVHTTDDDMQAFLELPDCEACDGSGKDDHATVFEAPLAVHFAAPEVEIAGRRRQLCLWCGHVLIDVPLADGQTAWPPWPKASLVRVEDGHATRQPYTYGDPLPPGCCALPDDEPPTPGPGCYPPADGWDGVAVRAAADRPPAAVEADNALRLHLASVHKLANAFALTAADAADAHQHDHFGPCGLRNHDVADRSYDEAVAHAVVAEADDGPDEAQETRAAADWPAEEADHA